jgi:6-phosphogluconate dehydrogenase
MQVSMELGFVGLGRMGADMAARLVGRGHRVVGFDIWHPTRARPASATPVLAHS